MIQANENYIIRKIMNESILFPTSSEIKNFQGGIKINDVTEFIWNNIQTPMEMDDVVKLITSEYNVDYSVAYNDLKNIIKVFLDMGIVYEL